MMTEINWTEVDGVRTIWGDTQGPLAAGLLFRTGRIDETIQTTGYTHLIEHMAISATGEHARRSNGMVVDAFTGFYTTGHTEDVTGFLRELCRALADLPGNRLDAEKQILAAENHSRGYDLSGNLLRLRYGAKGYGLNGFTDLGLRCATLEQLHEFSANRFTRENAVLWLNGPVPKNLQLDLPGGTKIPLPALDPILEELPNFIANDLYGGVAVGATVPRVAAASIFLVIAQKRLHEELRDKKALSYSPAISYGPMTADTAHLIMFADAEANRRNELADAFGEVYTGLGEINEVEIDTARRETVDHLTGPLAPSPNDRIMMNIQRAAVDWILDREYESAEALAAEMDTLSTSDIAAFYEEIKKTSLFALPGEAYVREWAGERMPDSLGPRVKGKQVYSVDYPIERIKLVHGAEGVTLKFSDASYYTVLYEELAGAIHYEDGAVNLIGNDATWLTIEPTLWRKGRTVCQKIYEHIPPKLLLEYGERSTDEIPKPKTNAWQRFIASIT